MFRDRLLLPILQKTYDESYLTCSKAVYYESQGDEIEAMRCWKLALDQIVCHNATKPSSSATTRSETEKALVGSLRQLEMQCKERIDLLEALRLSRRESGSTTVPSSSIGTLHATSSASIEARGKGWIGGGTIPAIAYTELSRPALPSRPSLPSRTSSEQAVIGSKDPSLAYVRDPRPVQNTKLSTHAEVTSAVSPRTSSSRSPERRMMRTTLRSGRTQEQSAKLSAKSSTKRTSDGPGASKAATLAWTALGLKEKRRTASPSQIEAVESSEPLRASLTPHTQWDSNSRRLVSPRQGPLRSPVGERSSLDLPSVRYSNEFPFPKPSPLSTTAASAVLSSTTSKDQAEPPSSHDECAIQQKVSGDATITALASPVVTVESESRMLSAPESGLDPGLKHISEGRYETSKRNGTTVPLPIRVNNASSSSMHRHPRHNVKTFSSSSTDEAQPRANIKSPRKAQRSQPEVGVSSASPPPSSPSESTPTDDSEDARVAKQWNQRKNQLLKALPPGVDEHAAKQILNEIVVCGDEVYWSDVAGLDVAKNALREAVVYPFLRPDLFMGLREPARGMLLFGPPGTGKTMLARAVATESKSTFFSISASSLTSKYLGESEKLVRALFALAKALAPSIIFVDEIDSLLSQRSGSGEHEATRRIKTEFLIQWSDLQRAAAGRETTERDRERGDASRVLVLAATNLPWAIDEAARRRFVRRQYIPLPEPSTRETQLRTLLGQQKHCLADNDIGQLVDLTEGFSGSDITALAKDAAMGPLRSLGEALLHMTMDQIRPIAYVDFLASLTTIRPSVSKAGLVEYEEWAKEFGERGG